MIFTNCQTITQQETTAGLRPINGLGAASRRALVGNLAVAYATETEKMIQQYLSVKEGLSGWHLGCGSGEDSFLIAANLMAPTSLLALDADPVLLQLASQSQEAKRHHTLQFQKCSPDLWQQNEKQNLDFIYARIWKGALPKVRSLFSLVHKQLKEGGKLILEVMSFSGYSSYPYNHAFARANDLLNLVETRNGGENRAWQQAGADAGFRQIQIHATSPAFLNARGKKLVSLILESLGLQIIDHANASSAELNALLLELNTYEQQQNTLVSKPSVLQLIAIK